MLAYLHAFRPRGVKPHSTTLGGTANETRLGADDLRHQFALKSAALDAGNLVQAMWRIEPESKRVASVKGNPGQHTGPQCGNRGYRNVKPRRITRVPALRSRGTPTPLARKRRKRR